MRGLIGLIVSALFVLSGCAIHPLPEDTTGVPTYIIVRKIRCEARLAVKDNLIQYLTAFDSASAAGKMGRGLADGTIPLSKFDSKTLLPAERAIVDKFKDTAIAYNFSFDMTEADNLDATIDFLRPFKPITDTASFTAGIDRSRENVRTFTVTDTFSGLLTNVKDDYCNKFEYGENYLYPIVGNIGVGEVIHTFVELALFGNLAAADPTKGGPPTLVDTLTFTTKLSTSLTPKIVVAPFGNVTQVADANLAMVASRTDAHKVIVGLALPVPPAKPAPAPAAGAAAPKAPSPTTLVIQGTFVNVIGNETQALAARAIDQVILRYEAGKVTVINPN